VPGIDIDAGITVGKGSVLGHGGWLLRSTMERGRILPQAGGIDALDPAARQFSTRLTPPSAPVR
ncbi:MAG: hypothetical protein WCE67_13110, partial [Azonexus sp.]